MDKRVVVFESQPGLWTYEFADGEWERDEAIAKAWKFADRNGSTVEVDFGIEQKQRAKRLGIDLAAPVKRQVVTSRTPVRRKHDPFEGSQW